jgi:hypothetical protein
MNVQWGTLTSNASSASEALGRAANAMRGQGFSIFLGPDDTVNSVIGGNNDVIVQVTAVSLQGSDQFLFVSAYADAEPVAEQARNTTRAGIR